MAYNYILQMSVLDDAARVHPSSWWWIKADGCDFVSGLCESVSGEWSGDVNLNQEVLDSAYKKYKERLEWVMHLGLEERRGDLGEISKYSGVRSPMISNLLPLVSFNLACRCLGMTSGACRFFF